MRNAGIQTILHAGDFVRPIAIDVLEEIAPVLGVCGNNDDVEIAARFSRTRIVEAAGFRIGITHGDVGIGRSTAERAMRAFAGDGVDAVVFGHSHIPLLERRDGVLLLNPGSPTDKRRQPRYSYATIDLNETLVARLHFFDDPSV